MGGSKSLAPALTVTLDCSEITGSYDTTVTVVRHRMTKCVMKYYCVYCNYLIKEVSVRHTGPYRATANPAYTANQKLYHRIMFVITLLTDFQSSLLTQSSEKLAFFSFHRLLVLASIMSRVKIRSSTSGTKIIAGYVPLTAYLWPFAVFRKGPNQKSWNVYSSKVNVFCTHIELIQEGSLLLPSPV